MDWSAVFGASAAIAVGCAQMAQLLATRWSGTAQRRALADAARALALLPEGSEVCCQLPGGTIWSLRAARSAVRRPGESPVSPLRVGSGKDVRLIDAIAVDELDAFFAVPGVLPALNAYAGRLLSTGWSDLEAGDVINETVARLYASAARTAWSGMQPPQRMAWLRTTMQRIIWEQRRRRTSGQTTVPLLLHDADADRQIAVPDGTDAVLERVACQPLWRALTGRQFNAVFLRYVRQCSHAEIGEHLGISPNTVGPMLGAARRKMTMAALLTGLTAITVLLVMTLGVDWVAVAAFGTLTALTRRNRRVVAVGTLTFLLFFLAYRPQSAAETVKNVGGEIMSASVTFDEFDG